MKKIVVEIDGVRHRLVRHKYLDDYVCADTCSLYGIVHSCEYLCVGLRDDSEDCYFEKEESK